MLPISFEWVWDTSHLVFFGCFWFAISVLGAGLTFCIGKTIWDTMCDCDNKESCQQKSDTA